MGLNHFMDVDTMAGYAEFKGLPAPRFSVIASGLVLWFSAGSASQPVRSRSSRPAPSPPSCSSRP